MQRLLFLSLVLAACESGSSSTSSTSSTVDDVGSSSTSGDTSSTSTTTTTGEDEGSSSTSGYTGSTSSTTTWGEPPLGCETVWSYETMEVIGFSCHDEECQLGEVQDGEFCLQICSGDPWCPPHYECDAWIFVGDSKLNVCWPAG